MTLGFQHNNPGNLRPGTQKWQGELDPDTVHNLCVFDTMENGCRALMRNLLAYQWKHDLNTVRGIISAAFVWVGFVLTTTATNQAFHGDKPVVTAIDAGHWLAVLVVMGAIIGAFGA